MITPPARRGGPFLQGSQIMFLSPADLKLLTGYTRRSAQAGWLTHHGWKFVANGLGQPIVAVAEFERHMVGGKGKAAAQQPNWEALNGRKRIGPVARAVRT
jgi:hypothetical protein